MVGQLLYQLSDLLFNSRRCCVFLGVRLLFISLLLVLVSCISNFCCFCSHSKNSFPIWLFRDFSGRVRIRERSIVFLLFENIFFPNSFDVLVMKQPVNLGIFLPVILLIIWSHRSGFNSKNCGGLFHGFEATPRFCLHPSVSLSRLYLVSKMC